MHDSSWDAMTRFVEVHLASARDTDLTVLDVGSRIVEPGQLSYRSLFDAPSWVYSGMDVEPGLNVDVAVAEPYRWDEIPADSFDVVISGQALEHIPYFWLTAFEIARVLKPGGITMLIAPSGGFEHRYPVDCWRFYRDGMAALAELVGCDVLDAHTSWTAEPWCDSVLVMRKPQWDHARRASFLRRRDAQYLACFGEEPAPAAVQGSPVPSALAPAAPGTLTAVLEPAPTAPTPAPTPAAPPGADAAWRRWLRRLLGERGLAVYRAARYGHSHPTE